MSKERAVRGNAIPSQARNRDSSFLCHKHGFPTIEQGACFPIERGVDLHVYSKLWGTLYCPSRSRGFYSVFSC